MFELPTALHRHLGERWSEPTRARMAGRRLPPAPPRASGQRRRIGYLSADFRDHAMGNLIHGVFSQHDRRRFEVFAYSLSDFSDPISAAIRNGVDHFKMVAEDSSDAIAQQIRADGIDVLDRPDGPHPPWPPQRAGPQTRTLATPLPGLPLLDRRRLD